MIRVLSSLQKSLICKENICNTSNFPHFFPFISQPVNTTESGYEIFVGAHKILKFVFVCFLSQLKQQIFFHLLSKVSGVLISDLIRPAAHDTSSLVAVQGSSQALFNTHLSIKLRDSRGKHFTGHLLMCRSYVGQTSCEFTLSLVGCNMQVLTVN